MTLTKRIHYILVSIAIFFVLGMMLSFKLWLTDRYFPHAPVGGFFPVLPSPLDFILLAAAAAGLLWIAFRPKLMFLRIVFGLLLLLLLQDQMRWQPWVFMYMLIFLPYLFIALKENEKRSRILLTCTQIVLIGMYLWSGIHKLNPQFFEMIFPAILKELFKISDPQLLEQLNVLGYAVPITEILVGLGLIFPKTRNIAVILGIATHLFILVYLSPLGINHNYVVYPWNLALICLVFLTFYKEPNKIEFWPKESRILPGISLLFALILPALNMVGKWDTYTSFNVYTGKLNDMYVVMPDREYNQLPPPIKKHYFQNKEQPGVKYINVGMWSLKELNVPVVPENRVFDAIAKDFCGNILKNSNNATFMEFARGKEPRTMRRNYKCVDIK